MRHVPAYLLKASGVAALIVALMGCAGSDDGGGPPVAGKEIGPAGGVLTSPDGRLTLTIPPNALASTETITIASVPVAASGAVADDIAALDPDLVYELRPDGLEFNVPASVRVETERDPDGTTGSIGAVALLLNSNDTLESLDAVASAPADGGASVVATAELEHFSQLIVKKFGFITFKLEVPDRVEIGDTFQAKFTIEMVPSPVAFDGPIQTSLFTQYYDEDDESGDFGDTGGFFGLEMVPPAEGVETFSWEEEITCPDAPMAIRVYGLASFESKVSNIELKKHLELDARVPCVDSQQPPPPPPPPPPDDDGSVGSLPGDFRHINFLGVESDLSGQPHNDLFLALEAAVDSSGATVGDMNDIVQEVVDLALAGDSCITVNVLGADGVGDIGFTDCTIPSLSTLPISGSLKAVFAADPAFEAPCTSLGELPNCVIKEADLAAGPVLGTAGIAHAVKITLDPAAGSFHVSTNSATVLEPPSGGSSGLAYNCELDVAKVDAQTLGLQGSCDRDIFFSNTAIGNFNDYYCVLTCPIENNEANIFEEHVVVEFDLGVNLSSGNAVSGTAQLGNPPIQVAVQSEDEVEVTREGQTPETVPGNLPFPEFLAYILGLLQFQS